ncbi:MAG: lipopolysaccharide heptosyltransferase II [Candidatus Brocadiae bacterium]|nr:lipopolysaccharide heptosyltransferase II [Candidatus Brocadiia bacterium]
MKKRENCMKSPNTILIRFPNWVGDVVMATPVAQCLKENYPQSKIIAIVRKYASQVLEDCPWLDDIIDCSDQKISSFWQTAQAVRALHPDMAIVLPNSWRSLLTLWLGGTKKIYGYRVRGRSLMLANGPKPLLQNGKILPIPMLEYYLEICRFLSLNIPHEPKPCLFFSEEVKQRGEALLQKHGIQKDDFVIGINPGAKFGSSKCWPESYFARLAELLGSRIKSKLLLFVGPGEEKIANSIISQSKVCLINTANELDLAILKPLVKRCQILVTNDTGTRHYAVALGVPTVVIIGSTDPRYTASNLEKTIVLREEIDCSPCHKKICPGDHKCMTMITPEKVLQACEKFM